MSDEISRNPAELKLVGRSSSTPSIELVDAQGEKFTLPITEDLKSAITAPRLVSVLPIDERPTFSVKEIQARLRAGESMG